MLLDTTQYLLASPGYCSTCPIKGPTWEGIQAKQAFLEIEDTSSNKWLSIAYRLVGGGSDETPTLLGITGVLS